ncbi:MAG: hypothetical protein E2P00_02600 [Acidobacteria bacterium]|nr:MAG: hypothetical protein E2P00_02600 [Acidobacteriota bacterium]
MLRRHSSCQRQACRRSCQRRRPCRWILPYINPAAVEVCGNGIDDGCSGVTDDGACSTCSNFIQDGDETDIDCGGLLCGPCIEGQMCFTDTDCSTGFCDPGGNVCGPPA